MDVLLFPLQSKIWVFPIGRSISTSRRRTDELGFRLERPIYFECKLNEPMHIGMQLLHPAATDHSVSICRQQVQCIFSFSLRSGAVTSFCTWLLLNEWIQRVEHALRKTLVLVVRHYSGGGSEDHSGGKPSRDHRSCAPQPVELPMECAGPSKRSVPAVSLALLPTTRCRSLHRRVSRSFWRGRFGCAAAPAVAMPESDLEMRAMLSRTAERVGLEWRKPLCPEHSRLDDWFLGVACAGSQRPAPGASLPVVDGTFYCQKLTC